MSSYPYTHLFLGASYTIAIAGPHIQLLDTLTGSILHSTASASASEPLAIPTLPSESIPNVNANPSAGSTNPHPKPKPRSISSRPITCASVDDSSESSAESSFKHLVTASDDKVVRVWEVREGGSMHVLSERVLPKKPTCLKITKREGTRMIVVSDKFGDVYRFPLHIHSHPSNIQSEGGENNDEVKLLMGHASVLTTFIFSPDERYIITADRDEHIRVSWYPESYVIERYCLGHLKYVTAIHTPTFNSSLLISGGGDPMLKIWDWMTGKLKQEIPIAEAVMPLIRVKRRKLKNHPEDEELEGSGRGMSVRERRKARKKVKAKRQQPDAGEEGDAKSGVVDGDGDEMDVDEPELESQEVPEQTLVVRRIDTLENLIIFSAVGSTALHYCSYVKSPSDPPTIKTHDFGKPVIDFVVNAPEKSVWVLVDGEWNEDSSSPEPIDMIHVLHYADESLVPTRDPVRQRLLNSLNQGGLLPASAAEIQALDLYSWLAAMPKNVGQERQRLARDDSIMAGSDDVEDDVEQVMAEDVLDAETDQASMNKDSKMSARQLGRLKRKKKVQDHLATSSLAPAGANHEAECGKAGVQALSEVEEKEGDSAAKRLKVES